MDKRGAWLLGIVEWVGRMWTGDSGAASWVGELPPGQRPGLPVIEVVEWGTGTAKSPGSGDSRITEHASVQDRLDLCSREPLHPHPPQLQVPLSPGLKMA